MTVQGESSVDESIRDLLSWADKSASDAGLRRIGAARQARRKGWSNARIGAVWGVSEAAVRGLLKRNPEENA